MLLKIINIIYCLQDLIPSGSILSNALSWGVKVLHLDGKYFCFMKPNLNCNIHFNYYFVELKILKMRNYFKHTKINSAELILHLFTRC